MAGIGMLAVAWAALAWPQAALVRTDDRVELPQGGPVVDDLYVAAGEVEIDAEIDGDLIIASGSVVVRGRVTGDVMVAGGDVRLEGPVDGSVRAAAGSLLIAGPVGRDLVVAAGSVDVRPGVVVSGDLLASGGEVSLAGEVQGDASVRAGVLDVSGHLNTLRFEGGELEVASAARVDGQLIYRAQEASFAPGAAVGSTQRLPTPRWPVAAGPLLLLILWGRTLVGLLVFGLLALALSPAWFERASQGLRRRPGESLGIGIAGAVIGASLSVVLFTVGLIVGGWWVGAVFAGLLLLALPVSLVIASLTLGRWMWRPGTKTTLPWLHFALGLLVLMVVALVPVVGQLVVLVAASAGFGAALLIALDVRRQARRVHPPAPPPVPARPVVTPPSTRPPASPPAVPPPA